VHRIRKKKTKKGSKAGGALEPDASPPEFHDPGEFAAAPAQAFEVAAPEFATPVLDEGGDAPVQTYPPPAYPPAPTYV
jgi:hypothetical protein